MQNAHLTASYLLRPKWHCWAHHKHIQEIFLCICMTEYVTSFCGFLIMQEHYQTTNLVGEAVYVGGGCCLTLSPCSACREGLETGSPGVAYWDQRKQVRHQHPFQRLPLLPSSAKHAGPTADNSSDEECCFIVLHNRDPDWKVDFFPWLSLFFIFWVDNCCDGTLVDGVVHLQQSGSVLLYRDDTHFASHYCW